MGLLAKLLRLLSRDLTGRTWVREAQHPYFGRTVYFGHQDAEQSYWEAELAASGLPKKVSVTLRGTPEGPEPAEEAFCRATLQDLDGLFERCRQAFEGELSRWSSGPLPADWREAFVLDGFSVPLHGDPGGRWDVTYFVEPAGHYFTAEVEGGQVRSVRVDG